MQSDKPKGGSLKKQTNRKPDIRDANQYPDETEELLLICKVIDSWGAPQKERALKYLFSKYNQFTK